MSNDNHNPRATPERGSVLDPRWEDELRRGQEAEGEAGSVDAELAFVHLLRHTREPEELGADQLDAIWADIEAEVAPAGVAWWRKAWVWWTAPALAAAAVLFVVVVEPGSKQSEGSVARQDVAAESDERMDEAKPAPASTPTAEASADAELDEGEARSRGGDGQFAAESAAIGEAKGKAESAFERNFVRLAPQGRVAIRVSVDQSRDALRAQLLTDSRGARGG